MNGERGTTMSGIERIIEALTAPSPPVIEVLTIGQYLKTTRAGTAKATQ